MDKLPLILFSGGLDSTYAVINALQTSDIDVLAVSCDSIGDLKVAAEKKARDTILTKLEALYNTRALNYRVRSVYGTEVNFPTNRWNSNGLQQVELWLNAAVNTINPDIHSELQIGYVKGDCAIAFLPNIKAIWDNWYAIRKHLSYTDAIELKFPIAHCSKENILSDLNMMGYQWVIDAVWTCEMPIEVRGKIKACGKCIPCITEAGARLKYLVASGEITVAEFRKWAMTRKSKPQLKVTLK